MPAGGVYSTIGDMAQFARKLLDGSAPGLASLVPLDDVRTDRENRYSGMFWIIDTDPETGRKLIWHNGGTGGYSSLIGIAPEIQQAVVVLANVGGSAAKLWPVASGLMGSRDDTSSSEAD